MAWNPDTDDIYKYFAMTPDRELQQWEEWVRIRQDEVIKLGIRTMRDPVNLEMNIIESCREDKERKKALEEAQILAKPIIEDSVSGKAFRLKQRCPSENIYELTKTSIEAGHPKFIEHVRCPDHIRENEKGVFGYPDRNPCNLLNFDYVNYRYEREKKFKDEIDKLDPYRPDGPDMSELVVIGRKPRTPPRKIPPLPQLNVLDPLEPCQDNLSGVYALRINNTVIFKNLCNQDVPELRKLQKEPWHEFCYSWTYYFNVPEKRIGRSKLYLENLGTVSLRYCWKKIRKMIPFIPEDIYEQKFFFYKSEDVLSPGQKKTLYFTFASENAGIFNESWELSLMNICLFDSLADKFVIHLVGDAVENIKKMTKKIEKLQNRINRKALEKYFRRKIDDMIITATSVEHQTYPYKNLLLEAELFVARNPVCFYHQTEVQKLKESYKEMTNETWDLKISTWRDAMILKDYEERMSYFNILKNSYNVLLKPWYEGVSIQYEKHRAVKLLLGQLLDLFLLERNNVAEWNGMTQMSSGDAPTINTPIKEGPLSQYIVQNIFFMRMYIHMANFVETMAGVVSSIDLKRWIDFDFCQ